MINGTNGIKSLSRLVVLFLSINGNIGNPLMSQTVQELVEEFVPQGATVESLRSVDPITKTETKTLAAKIGHLRRKDSRDIAFIYKKGDQLKLRVVLNPQGQAAILDRYLPGTFLWMQDFSTNGFQILDLNADGVDEIVTITSQGASIGAYLNIFTVRGGAFESLLSNTVAVGGYKFKFEPHPNRKYRIIIYGKWTEKENSTVDVYEWNGQQYLRSNGDFPQYYNAELEKILQEIYSREPKPAPWRATLTTQVVGIYIRQQRYPEAVRLCNDMLRIIDDPILTVVPKSAIKEDAAPEERNRILAWWEVNKIEVKALIYRLVGDTYKAAGDLQRAEKEYQRARRLEAEAKQRASKLPR